MQNRIFQKIEFRNKKSNINKETNQIEQKHLKIKIKKNFLHRDYQNGKSTDDQKPKVIRPKL